MRISNILLTSAAFFMMSHTLHAEVSAGPASNIPGYLKGMPASKDMPQATEQNSDSAPEKVKKEKTHKKKHKKSAKKHHANQEKLIKELNEISVKLSQVLENMGSMDEKCAPKDESWSEETQTVVIEEVPVSDEPSQESASHDVPENDAKQAEDKSDTDLDVTKNDENAPSKDAAEDGDNPAEPAVEPANPDAPLKDASEQDSKIENAPDGESSEADQAQDMASESTTDASSAAPQEGNEELNPDEVVANPNILQADAEYSVKISKGQLNNMGQVEMAPLYTLDQSGEEFKSYIEHTLPHMPDLKVTSVTRLAPKAK